MKTLIIVDMQNDFVTGSLATDPDETFVQQTAAWLQENIHTYAHIIVTKDWHKTSDTEHIQGWGEHCMVDTVGAALHSAIAEVVQTHDHVETFLKGQYDHGYSGFEGVNADDDTPLGDWLKAAHVHTVDIVGIATEHCVRATAFDAVESGLQTTVLKDFVNAVDDTAGEVLLNGGFQERGVEVL